MTNKINCDEIYGLYFIDPECNLDQYILAVSLSKENLNNILNDIINKNYLISEYSSYIIKKIKSYSLIKYDNKFIFTRNLSMNETIFYKSLYAYNKIIFKNEMEICEQVLLNIFEENNEEKILLGHDISNNPIIFDKYYEESIMNS